MAINSNLLLRQAERRLFLIAAVAFPLLVLIGYARSYYFSAFFDVRPIANALVHAHGIVMSLWVVYFVAQVALIRSKNIKLHMSMGMAGVGLAALVVVVGLATAYDAQLVRHAAPPGIDPHEFFILPVGDMLLFVVYFAGAIYYRKRPLEHKSLMLMTAINFTPAALFRIPVVPENYVLLFTFGIPALTAIFCLVWLRSKHGEFNRVFAAAILLYLIALPFPFRMAFAETAVWHGFTNWLAS
ncbi:MAG TPA: hypothetical protein VGB00_13965 [Pyrinomonadaceae bacterium]|jgi:hypothetical protein